MALWPNPRNPALAGKTKTSALLSKGDLSQSLHLTFLVSEWQCDVSEGQALQGVLNLWKEARGSGDVSFFCFYYYIVLITQWLGWGSGDMNL